MCIVNKQLKVIALNMFFLEVLPVRILLLIESIFHFGEILTDKVLLA